MAFMQWRRYAFFDIKLIKENATNQEFTYLKDVNITCASSGRSLLVFGDASGRIHMINRQLEVSCFEGFKVCVEHIQQMQQNAYLVAVGLDEAGINPLIKVWNQDKQDMQGGPFCVRSMRAIIGNKPASVSAFRVNDNMSVMAVGFDDGRLLLIRGDITRSSARQTRNSHLTVAAAPITGIEFQGSSQAFVVTTVSVHLVSFQSHSSATLLVNAGVRSPGGEPVCVELDHKGCKPGCCAITEPRRGNRDVQFIIGCGIALYLFQSDGIGPCLAFDADKELVSWFRNYLVCVVRDNDKTILNVYDIHNKYVAYSTPLMGIRYVLPHWGGGELIVITKEGKIFSFTEKSTEDRLAVLFRKNQYELAVKLAKSNNYDGIVDIFRQYGDHLYAKGDHDGAVEQYIKTIGKLEESYVIRKLLDAQKIKQLTEYLQELHQRGLAREDHTTLLLNCYTNINQVETLSQFIQTSDLQFDVEIAIKVCRNSELYKEALYLAEKHKLTDYYLKIQLENLKNFDDAIRYIERLPFKEAEENLEKYGKVLMDNSPEATTSLLCRLCTNFEGRKSPAEKFIHIFVNKSQLLKGFLQQIIAELGDKVNLSPIIYNTLLELELQEYMAESQPSRRVAKELEIMCFLREKKNCYDTDLALGLCQINNFKPGFLHLYEKAELYHQILSFYTDMQDYASVIDVCTRFGASDPSLWLHALLILAHADDNNGAKQYFMSVLSHIEKHSLLPAILVVSIAAGSKTATLSLVKEFLVRQLSVHGDKIRNCERTIKELKKETESIREQMDNIRHKPHVFQESKCSGCKIELELPSVHFLCGHSFHVNCFENFTDNNGCPSCAPQNNLVLEQQRQMDEAMETLEQDFSQRFSTSEDVLATVADFFAKGVFKTTDPCTEAVINDINEYTGIRKSTNQPKNIFEKPSEFAARVYEPEPNTKKSIFDKPDPFERRPPQNAPGPLDKNTGRQLAEHIAEVKRAPQVDALGKTKSPISDNDSNNPFADSLDNGGVDPTSRSPFDERRTTKDVSPQHLRVASDTNSGRRSSPVRSGSRTSSPASTAVTARGAVGATTNSGNPFENDMASDEENGAKPSGAGDNTKTSLNPFGDDPFD